MLKKITSLVLIMVLAFSLSGTAIAANATTTQLSQDQAASVLKDLGLFMGTAKGFELDRALTRTEAIVLLLRMLGLEQEAKDSNYTHTFTDVPAWADKQIAYAYNKGLANGYSKTTFGSNDNATPEQFCALALRALQYTEKDGDFVYSESIKKAEEMGLATVGKYKAGSKDFTRGDCVDIIYKALSVVKKTEGVTLTESLIKKGVIDGVKAESYGLYSVYKKIRVPLREYPGTGEITLFLADAIKQVPGAKYGTITGYGGTTPDLNDYEKAFDSHSSEILLNPNKTANSIELLTNNYTQPSIFRTPKDVIAIALYDEKINTMIAASLDTVENISKNEYMDFVLVNIDMRDFLSRYETKFNELFGNPVEAPNAINTIEKAKVHVVYIDNKTNIIKDDFMDDNIKYRFVIDSNKYPDLEKKTANFNDFSIPAGMTALEAIKKDYKGSLYGPGFTGSFVGVYPVMDYVRYSNQWTQYAADWNTPRYVVFDDGETPIAYTTIYPSQLEVVDVGTAKVEIYKDYETNKEVRRVYTKE